MLRPLRLLFVLLFALFALVVIYFWKTWPCGSSSES